MISLTSDNFRKLYRGLPSEVRAQARKSYQFFKQNPGHPSLRFKPLGGETDLWSVRVSLGYRCVGKRDGDTIKWIWIGTHNEFDKLFS